LGKNLRLEFDPLINRAQFITASPGFFGCLDITRAQKNLKTFNVPAEMPRIVYPMPDIHLAKPDNPPDGPKFLKSSALRAAGACGAGIKYDGPADAGRSQPPAAPDSALYYMRELKGQKSNKIGLWKKQLLDMPLRNQYLNCHLEKSFVQIVTHDIGTLHKTLLTS
jgi:hypothetical protein